MPYIAWSTSNGNFQHCIYYYVLLWYIIIYYITIYYTPWWDTLKAWRWWLDLGQDSDFHQQKWDLKPRMVSCDHDLGTLEVGCLLKWLFFEALSGAVSAHRQCVNISLKKTLHISASWSSHNRVSIFLNPYHLWLIRLIYSSWQAWSNMYQISPDQRYILWSTSAKVKRLTHGCPLFGPSGIFDFL